MKRIAMVICPVLVATVAHAASHVFAGPMTFLSGQSGAAGIANVSSTRPLTNVAIQCRNQNGAIVVNASTPALAPGTSFSPGTPAITGTFSCEFSADQSARSYRATLSNLTTGAILQAQ